MVRKLFTLATDPLKHKLLPRRTIQEAVKLYRDHTVHISKKKYLNAFALVLTI